MANRPSLPVRRRLFHALLLLFGILVLAAAVIAGLAIGRAMLRPGEVIGVLNHAVTGNGHIALTSRTIVMNVRLPRVVAAAAIGAALAVSGLASDRFTFEGFPPRRRGERHRALTALAAERRTMIFFESPRRTRDTLDAMVRAFGARRRAALCRELTKTHEQVRRATLGELVEATAEAVLGEVVIVVAGAPALAADPHSAAREALELADGGMRLKSAAGWTAQRAGLRPNEVYRAALALRETDPTAGGEHAVPEDSAESPAGDLGHDRHLR